MSFDGWSRWRAAGWFLTIAILAPAIDDLTDFDGRYLDWWSGLDGGTLALLFIGISVAAARVKVAVDRQQVEIRTRLARSTIPLSRVSGLFFYPSRAEASFDGTYYLETTDGGVARFSVHSSSLPRDVRPRAEEVVRAIAERSGFEWRIMRGIEDGTLDELHRVTGLRGRALSRWVLENARPVYKEETTWSPLWLISTARFASRLGAAAGSSSPCVWWRSMPTATA